ncbi:hypothetical protein MKX01_022303 [Papaver californicum]|nr:hypothetical protein MKX01_022303 [Papaver californicum]
MANQNRGTIEKKNPKLLNRFVRAATPKKRCIAELNGNTSVTVKQHGGKSYRVHRRVVISLLLHMRTEVKEKEHESFCIYIVRYIRIYSRPMERLRIRMKVQDGSGTTWLQASDENAENVIHKTKQNLLDLKKEGKVARIFDISKYRK